MSKKNDWSKTTLILGIIFAITLLFITIWTTKIHFNFNGNCRLENIDYIELEENITCWNNMDDEGFLNEHCPMPQTVDCDFSVTMPLDVKTVVGFLRELD